jgi:DnaK suppressor protein
MKANGKYVKAKEILLVARARLRTVPPGGTPRQGDLADAATANALQETERILAEGATERLAEIDLALLRLARGEYGACEDCGGTLAAGRLLVLPWARRCVLCQGEIDRGYRVRDSSFGHARLRAAA